jgi:hypothetical protein
VKLLRTIRLDASDSFVFERAAEPGEWAVSGAFAFAHCDQAQLQGKARAAFRAGFLGLGSLGRSTLVQIVVGDALWNGGELSDAMRAQLVGLFRLNFRDPTAMIERVKGEPVYLLMAMAPDEVLRLKPQNLVTGLPIREEDAVN